MNCELCGKELKSFIALSQHITKFHKITTENYYKQFLMKSNEGFCEQCHKPTKFKNISLGYQKFCNLTCSNNNDIRKEKFKNTYLSNDLNLIKEKRENTNLQRYGNKNANQIDDIKERNRNSFLLSKSHQKLKYIKNWNIELLDDITYKTINEPLSFKCQKCGIIFQEKLVNVYQRMYKCKCEIPASRSNKEEELYLYIKKLFDSQNIEIIPNYRFNNIEIDIYIPHLNIGIEYNGLYWHSEKIQKDPINYHINKLKICQNNNIHLIQIFEDEWINKKRIVKSRLKQILGLNQKNKIYARNCIIKEISSNIKNSFLQKYHLLGDDKSNIKLGAFYNNKLVAVMTFSKGNRAKGSKPLEGIWELNRFCSIFSFRIIGIASKLLSF